MNQTRIKEQVSYEVSFIASKLWTKLVQQGNVC